MQVHTKFNGELSFQVWGAESLDEQGNPLGYPRFRKNSFYARQ
jgi:hypothetical protein